MTQQPLVARSVSLPPGKLLSRAQHAAMVITDSEQNSEPTSEELHEVPQTVGSFVMSIAFWTTLLVSAFMYAAVALSPKIADWINVRQQYESNSLRLQELEDEADYLERVAAALKKDPEFARRLVRATQSSDSTKEFVPVARGLMFGGDNQKKTGKPSLLSPTISKILVKLASDGPHRTWLLAGAAGFTLLAFTLLNDAGGGIVLAMLLTVKRFSIFVLARYQRNPAERAELVEALEVDEGETSQP